MHESLLSIPGRAPEHAEDSLRAAHLAHLARVIHVVRVARASNVAHVVLVRAGIRSHSISSKTSVECASAHFRRQCGS